MKITITREFDTVEEALAFLAPVHVINVDARSLRADQLGAGVPSPSANAAEQAAGTQPSGGAGAPAATAQPSSAAPAKPPRKPRSDAGKPRGPYKQGDAPPSPTTNANPAGAGAPADPAVPVSPAPAAASAAAPQSAPAGEASELTLDGVRGLLSKLNAVPGKGVMACTLALRQFGVLRISELPKEKYAEFAAYINGELAKAAA